MNEGWCLIDDDCEGRSSVIDVHASPLPPPLLVLEGPPVAAASCRRPSSSSSSLLLLVRGREVEGVARAASPLHALGPIEVRRQRRWAEASEARQPRQPSQGAAQPTARR